MLLGTLGTSLLGDVLAKGLSGKGVIRAGEGTIRAGYGSKRPSLKKFDSSATSFFSRDNLPNNNIKNGAYVINLDEYHDIGTPHWIALYVNNKIATYFDSFGVEHIPKEIMKFIVRKKIIKNIYRIQPYDSIMCGYFCIGFINVMFNGKGLTDYTNLFSPNDLKKER